MNLPPEVEAILGFAQQINSTNKNHNLTGNSRASQIQAIDPKKILNEIQSAAHNGTLVQNNAHTTVPQAISAPILDADGNIVSAANTIPQSPGFVGQTSPLTQEIILQFLQVIDGISNTLSNIEKKLSDVVKIQEFNMRPL